MGEGMRGNRYRGKAAFMRLLGRNTDSTVSASITKKAPDSGAFFSPLHRGKSKKVVRLRPTLFSYIRLCVMGRKRMA